MRSSSRLDPVKSFARRADDCVMEAGWLNCNLPPGTATQTSSFWLTQHHRHTSLRDVLRLARHVAQPPATSPPSMFVPFLTIKASEQLFHPFS